MPSQVPAELQALAAVASRLLLSTAAVQQIEREQMAAQALPGIVLMKRAARAVFVRVRALHAQTIVVFCGSGNNAGDGYLIAALAHAARLRVLVVRVGARAKLPPDAARAYAFAESAGVPMCDWQLDDRRGNADVLATAACADLLIDALLGTGAKGAPRAACAAAIDAINSALRPVLAVDVPSGLCADTGAAPGVVVRACETITFIAVKPGLLTARGPEFCGALSLAPLALDAAAMSGPVADLERVAWRTELALPRRRRDAHKGDSGHVLVLGGAPGMGGAAILAAQAALRCGAGLVSVGCAHEHVPALLARQPELMACGIDGAAPASAAEQPHIEALLRPLLARASVIAIGPGLGQLAFGRVVLAAALASAKPLVLDADALNILAAGSPLAAADPAFVAHWPADAVLTPHPAEAARILGISTADVQADRFAAARALVALTGAVIVLKGAGSLVADAQRIRVCTDGNPGMAVGGMGDVLTGVIAALRAQGRSAFDAAVQGVCMHARAADLAIEDGERGLLASELLPFLRRLGNGMPAR